MGAAMFYHLTRTPAEGLVPTLIGKSQSAGWRIEPPVSVPVAAGAMRAETEAEEPPEEPPGLIAALVSAFFHGEDTLPK